MPREKETSKLHVLAVLLVFVLVAYSAVSVAERPRDVNALLSGVNVNPSSLSTLNVNSSGNGAVQKMVATRPLHVVGADILNDLDQIVQLRGVNLIHGDDDPTLSSTWDGSWVGAWSIDRVERWCQFMVASGLNFGKINTRLEYFHYNTSSWNSHVSDALDMAASYGIYLEFVNAGIESGWPDTPYGDYSAAQGVNAYYPPHMNPYDQDLCADVAAINLWLDEMADVLKSHNNAIFGLWNEPAINSTDHSDAYWNNVPSSLQAIRDAGFIGIIAVMGEISFAPGSSGFSGMNWAISHPHIFIDGDYGSVIADFHSYYTYLHGYGYYPDAYGDLYTLWFTTGEIQTALNDGICVVHFEDAISNGGDADEIQAFENGMNMMLDAGRSTVAHKCSLSGDFQMLSGGDGAYAWNSNGQAFIDLVTAHFAVPPVVPATVTGRRAMNITGMQFTNRGF